MFFLAALALALAETLTDAAAEADEVDVALAETEAAAAEALDETEETLAEMTDSIEEALAETTDSMEEALETMAETALLWSAVVEGNDPSSEEMNDAMAAVGMAFAVVDAEPVCAASDSTAEMNEAKRPEGVGRAAEPELCAAEIIAETYEAAGPVAAALCALSVCWAIDSRAENRELTRPEGRPPLAAEEVVVAAPVAMATPDWVGAAPVG